MPNEITIGYETIPIHKLASKDDLFAFFKDHGATMNSLMTFTDPYTDQYNNPLYWHYSISEGKHEGFYLVLTSDGFLVLPYDEIKRTSGQQFILEDACFCTNSKDVQVLIDDWSSNNTDILRILNVVHDVLTTQEKEKYLCETNP